jgi:hypothetical protein
MNNYDHLQNSNSRPKKSGTSSYQATGSNMSAYGGGGTNTNRSNVSSNALQSS